jgi:hypothetical protein
MSSDPALRPLLRIVLTSRRIELRDVGSASALCQVDLLDPRAGQAVAELAAHARARAGAIEVVLPEAELARGRLTGADPAPLARVAAARALGTPEGDLLVSLGEPDATGGRDWAAVRCEAIYETRVFLGECGLEAIAISPPGDLPPFLTALAPPGSTPKERARRRVPRRLPAAAALLAGAALLAWPFFPEARRQPVETSLDAESVTLAGRVPESGPGPAPMHRPPQLVAIASTAAPPAARAEAPQPLHEPILTISARNLPTFEPAPPTHHVLHPFRLETVTIEPLTVPPMLSVLVAQTTRDASSDAGPIRPFERPAEQGAAQLSVPVLMTATGTIARPFARPIVAGPSAEAVTASVASAVVAARSESLVVDRPLARAATPAAERIVPTTYAPAPPAVTDPALTSAQPRSATVVALAAPTATSRAAREIVGLSARDMSLLGVFGSPSQKRALIRLPNGSVRKVRAGDRIDGGRVLAVGSDSVRLSDRGRETILRLPY